jgi:hypothetical protein
MTTHDEYERAFLRDFARDLGVEELTSEALAKSLGFDELTREKLEEWFITEVLGEVFGHEQADTPEPAARVVQVERDERPAAGPSRAALPAARPKR